MVRRRLVICSLDSSGMPLGNGLVLSDLTLKPSFLEAPEHPEFFSIRTEKVSGTQPSLYSLQGAGDSAPALPISVSFPLIPAQIEKNTRNSSSSQLYKIKHNLPPDKTDMEQPDSVSPVEGSGHDHGGKLSCRHLLDVCRLTPAILLLEKTQQRWGYTHIPRWAQKCPRQPQTNWT